MAKMKVTNSGRILSAKKYRGNYVAMATTGSCKVVAKAKKAGEVADMARKKGVSVPAIVFVPENNIVCLY